MDATQTDDLIMLDGTDFPLSSMALTALVGSTGSGKTYQMFKIQEQYNKVSNKKYDFDEMYNVLYTPFTHQFYISGTKVKVEAPYIFKDDQELPQIIQYIMTMSDDFDDVAKAQRILMNLNGQEPALQLKHFIELIELMKVQYPELVCLYKSPVISGIYQLFGLKYDGYMVRRPKISIILDDSSGMKIWQGTSGNYWYRFLSRRRHYSVYNCLIATHSITVLFGQFREIFSSYLLFRDVNSEHIKMLYNQSLGMSKKDFQFKDFLELYQNHSGANDSAFDQEAGKQKQHNFVYIMRQPEKHIYLDFTKKIF